ncbi:MAG: general secretion pathway protein GspL [Burkholderiaceae bacterium]|nr:general secretion pathway protein GspL [Burkholderiaceae bacterium]
MSLLLILLPQRPPPPGEPVPALAWALSTDDGLTLSSHGQGQPAQWPAADQRVAVLPPQALAWHRISPPKAPAARLRAALGGLLEDQLLADDEAVHLALSPDARAGQPAWVAATDRATLAAWLAALQAAGAGVDRVLPLLAPMLAGADKNRDPDSPAQTGLVTLDEAGDAWLSLADADQALSLPLDGSLAPQLLARGRGQGLVLAATPAAMAAAERAWASVAGSDGGPAVAVRSEAEQALAMLRAGWQLRQFGLAPQHRGLQALGALLGQWRAPALRPLRWGLVALVLVQLAGLNLLAWRQRQALDQGRSQAEALLRQAHPQVRAILDAPLQMRRETALLREAAGVPGDGDFEPLLAALSAAWPEGLPPLAQLQFEPGRLSLPAGALPPPLVEQLRSRLQAGGWALELSQGRLTVQRADGGRG